MLYFFIQREELIVDVLCMNCYVKKYVNESNHKKMENRLYNYKEYYWKMYTQQNHSTFLFFVQIRKLQQNNYK